jgi:hypothetical protein
LTVSNVFPKKVPGTNTSRRKYLLINIAHEAPTVLQSTQMTQEVKGPNYAPAIRFTKNVPGMHQVCRKIKQETTRISRTV